MTINNVKSLPQPDGSTAYIVNNIYTALPDDPMWQSIQDWLAAGNTAEEYVPPDPLITVTTPAQRQINAIMENLPQLLLSLATGTGTDPFSVALQQAIKGVT